MKVWIWKGRKDAAEDVKRGGMLRFEMPAGEPEGDGWRYAGGGLFVRGRDGECVQFWPPVLAGDAVLFEGKDGKLSAGLVEGVEMRVGPQGRVWEAWVRAAEMGEVGG
jgi:hypothetical protein